MKVDKELQEHLDKLGITLEEYQWRDKRCEARARAAYEYGMNPTKENYNKCLDLEKHRNEKYEDRK